MRETQPGAAQWLDRCAFRRLRMTPLPLLELSSARVVSRLLLALLQTVLLLGVGKLGFNVHLGALCLITIGFFVGAVACSQEAAAVVGDVVTLPCAALARLDADRSRRARGRDGRRRRALPAPLRLGGRVRLARSLPVGSRLSDTTNLVESTVEELEGNRVRLTVGVPSHDVKHAVEHAAADIAGSMKIPGFRKGKAPLPIVVQRVGREVLIAEAVDSHIGGWFWNAATRTRVQPVSQPEYEFELPASSDADWSFSAVFDVQPKPELADWSKLEVPWTEAKAPAADVELELERLRDAVAELAPVEGRGAAEGDTVVLDLVSSSGEVQNDYVVEVGSGRLLPELEQALVGVAPGETKTIDLSRGEEAFSVDVTLKDLKQKVLPPLDDELARSASEFDTLSELRADIETKLEEQLAEELDVTFRTAVVDSLVEASKVEPAPALVESRAAQAWNGLVRSIARRGIEPAQYFQITGRDPVAVQERLRLEAGRSVARELTLDAVADKLGIEVSDDEVKAAIRENAEAAGESGEAAIEELFGSGRHEDIREDLRMRAALDRVAAEVRRVPADLARIREQIWTPEKETPETPAKLWTPGSKEPV